MIEINCYGGRIGRFWWENSDRGGTFLRSGQFRTTFRPGRCGWDEAWPDHHAWPVRPWGKGDVIDEHWRDFAAFEPWYQDQLAKRKLDEIDLTITEKIELYAMVVDIFYAGIEAGQDPWGWAQQVERQTVPAMNDNDREALLPNTLGTGTLPFTNRGGSMPDWRIRQLAAEGMISPFEPGKVRRIITGETADGASQLAAAAISYGCSSYGYDLTLAPHDFRVFRHVPGLIVNPKAFDDRCLAPAELHEDAYGRFFILPAHTYALGVVIERQALPPHVTALYIGKSTYARCGVIVNITPGEAGWEGFLTVEISNSSGADCRIYANEGICQALFYEGVPCDRPYGDGKYQGQASGVTVAKV